MLISDTKEFIFIHIPKTAGSSIRSALAPHAIDNPTSYTSRLLKQFNLPNNYHKFRFKLHSTLQDAQEKMPSSLYSNYKKIGFVRNPWDRMASSFAYKVHGTNDKVRNRNDSFEEFIHQEFKRKKKQQRDYLENSHGELDCDFIGRFESLATDYATMQDVIGIELPPLPVKNASKRQSDYRDYYTPELKQLVGQYYQKDIDTFGYTF